VSEPAEVCSAGIRLRLVVSGQSLVPLVFLFPHGLIVGSSCRSNVVFPGFAVEPKGERAQTANRRPPTPSEVVELCTDPIARCGSGDGLTVRICVTRTGTVF